MGFLKWIKILYPCCCKVEEDEDTEAMEDRIQEQPTQRRVSNPIPIPTPGYEFDLKDENLLYGR